VDRHLSRAGMTIVSIRLSEDYREKTESEKARRWTVLWGTRGKRVKRGTTRSA
jgi:hypothetical protein